MTIPAAPGVGLKEPKVPKAPKAPKVPKVSRFATLFPNDAKLTVIVTANPKKEGSATRGRFEGYFKSKTVGEALKNGVTYADMAYDVGRNFVKIG